MLSSLVLASLCVLSRCRPASSQYENYGATEALVVDGLLYKPRLLAKHAAAVVVAAAHAASEEAAALAQAQAAAAAATQADSSPGDAAPAALVSTQPSLPADAPSQVGDSNATPEQGDTGSSPSEAGLLAASAGLRQAGGRRLATVFSPDDRTEITTRQQSLVRAVGRITFDLEGSNHFCSGAMIGHYAVLTAAHCVVSLTQPGITATSLAFTPAITK